MIVELHDGREFKLADDTEEDKVDELVKALLSAESKAAAAEAGLAAITARLDAQANEPRDTGLADEIRQLRTELNVGIGRIVDAQLADTVLVTDDRSKKVIRGNK